MVSTTDVLSAYDSQLRRLVPARTRMAAAHGVKYLRVDDASDSEPILRGLGFRATTTPFCLDSARKW